MNHGAVISSDESLRILKNDLRKAALAKHAAQLAKATADERQKTIERIERDVEKELRLHKWQMDPGTLIH